MAARSIFYQAQDLGITGSIATFNQATLPVLALLGSIFEDSGKFYRLVKHDQGSGSVATVAGHTAVWKTRSTFTVTGDNTDMDLTGHAVAGGYLGVVTNGNYCFVQCGGQQTGVKVSASTAISDPLLGPLTASTDGQLQRITGGVSQAATTGVAAETFAIAVTAVSGGTSTVQWFLGKLL